MTPRYVWQTVCSDMTREDSQLLMEDMKSAGPMLRMRSD
ncbi:hypothetical protein GQ600_7023 [Phytophthora cactorum]|nr:hypothetical protein GQ600_7023 [Phytophthora cactorum]